jgi:hypothetical protein
MPDGRVSSKKGSGMTDAAAIAEIGHNKPPSRVDELIAWDAPCNTEGAAKDYVRVIKEMTTTIESLDTQRKNETEPLRDEVAAINRRCTEPIDALKSAKARLTGRLHAWRERNGMATVKHPYAGTASTRSDYKGEIENIGTLLRQTDVIYDTDVQTAIKKWIRKELRKKDSAHEIPGVRVTRVERTQVA